MTDALPLSGEDVEPFGPTLVEVRGGTVVFSTRKGIFRSGEVHALNGVDLEIRRGETLALVGESGSGKTTLGRLTLRLVEPVSGTVLFDGEDITHRSDGELVPFRQRAQIVFQDPFSSLNPYMSVQELTEEPLIIDGVSDARERRNRVYEALESVDLTPASSFAAKYPNQMSGGQRQRVGIARALVRNPDYIVTDEPVSMIDASSRIEILNLLDRLQHERRMAFLFITHDIATARYFADRIAVMYAGNIVEAAAASEIIVNPMHPYSQALIAAIPEPDPQNRFIRRAVVPGEPGSNAGAAAGCPFFDRCPKRLPGICDTTRPVLTSWIPDHVTACHLYDPAYADAASPMANRDQAG
ncbi:MAG: oligopeptide/dipeptide ABC transporter ATP-binding protein [Thermomicrobiales bacterium]